MKAKKSKKWKPKYKWIESVIINTKTNTKKYKYKVPKSPEEEQKWQKEHNERMIDTIKLVLDGKT